MKNAAATQPLASPARERLCEALTDFQCAQGDVSDAQEIAARAAAAFKQANDVFKSFDGLDGRMAAFHVEALKADRWTGKWPAELQSERLEKLAADEDVRHALAAKQTLDAEVQTAQENLAEAEKQFDQAALDVFFESIMQVVTQLDEVNRQQKYLKLILKGACLPVGVPGDWERLAPAQQKMILQGNSIKVGFPHGDAKRWELLHRLAVEAVYPGAVPERSDAFATASAYWRNYADGLHGNPGVELGPLPSRDSILA